MPEGSGAFLLPMLIIVAVRRGATSNPWSRRTEGRRPWRRHPSRRWPMNRGWPAGGPSRETYPRHAGPPMGDLMYKVCSTSGCPHLVSSGSLCDECRKAKDKRRSRGRNPYTSKAHRLARARVLARDPTDAAGTMACAAPPAPSPTIGRSNASNSSKPDWTPTIRRACAACASVATTARRQGRNLQASTVEAFADSSHLLRACGTSSQADDVRRAPQA